MRVGDEPILFVALDDTDKGKVIKKAEAVAGEGNFGYKINLDFFFPPSYETADAYKTIVGFGKPLFIDLKIWNGKRTMHSVAKSLLDYTGGDQIKFINAHCQAGEKFLQKMKEATADRAQLLGVTVLTHYTDEDCQRMYGRNLADSVRMLAEIGQRGGVDGFILPGTALLIVEDMGLLKLNPGIRPAWYKDKKANAQEQTVTPAEAIHGGADILVAGSPIFKSQYRPREALEKILGEMNEAYAGR